MALTVHQTYLTQNDCYRSGGALTPQGLMLHSVGCAQPDAMAFVQSWNQPGVKACVHGFIDANTGAVYQTLPWTCRGWHGGGSSNNTHIGVEMCEPASIRYTSGANFLDQDHRGGGPADLWHRRGPLCPAVPDLFPGPSGRWRHSLPPRGPPAGHRHQPRGP